MDDERLREDLRACVRTLGVGAAPPIAVLTRRIRARRIKFTAFASAFVLAGATGGILGAAAARSSESTSQVAAAPTVPNDTKASAETSAPTTPSAVSPLTSAPVPPVDICSERNLELSNPRSLNGGMGAVVVAIVFRNVGSKPCALMGWPTITPVSVKANVLYQTTTGSGFEVAVTRIVLRPGEAAAASLELFAAPGGTYGAQCAATGSWSVTPPGAHGPERVPWPAHQGPCSDGTVLVSPVYEGADPKVGYGSADPGSIPSLGPFSSPPTLE